MTSRAPAYADVMSTDYYLHSTDFAESVRIGTSTGDRWTTDTACPGPGDQLGAAWATTGELLAYLDAQGDGRAPFEPWVADEYGRTWPLAKAADIIRSHPVHREFPGTL